MLPRPRVLPRHLQRLMPLETCRLIEAYPGYFSKMGFPDFPKSRPNRDRGQIPDYFPDPGAIGIIGKIPAFPAKSGQDRAGWGISGSESGSRPQGRRGRGRRGFQLEVRGLGESLERVRAACPRPRRGLCAATQ